MTILDQLAESARERTLLAKKELPMAVLRKNVLSLPKGTFSFEQALRKPGMSFICECKKASPSKGLMDPDFPYLDIAREYQKAGADCILSLIHIYNEPDHIQQKRTGSASIYHIFSKRD